jgi:hypothetical protein
VALLSIVVAQQNLGTSLFHAGVAETSVQTATQMALQAIARDARTARSIRMDLSTPERLVLQMPLYQYDPSGTTQTLVLPLRDGPVVSYFLRGDGGLVRSEAGVDAATRITLQELRFAYPAAGPSYVQVTVRATSRPQGGSSAPAKDLPATQTVFLQNYGL